MINCIKVIQVYIIFICLQIQKKKYVDNINLNPLKFIERNAFPGNV